MIYLKLLPILNFFSINLWIHLCLNYFNVSLIVFLIFHALEHFITLAGTTQSTGFAAIKLTALGRPQLLVCGFMLIKTLVFLSHRLHTLQPFFIS